MLVSTTNIAGVSYRSAADEQAMMGDIQSRGVGHRAANDRPLGDYGAFFEINDGDMTMAFNNVAHGYVQSFPRRVDGYTCRVTTRQFNASHQFSCRGVYDVDRSIGRPVFTATAKIFKDFNTGIN